MEYESVLRSLESDFQSCNHTLDSLLWAEDKYWQWTDDHIDRRMSFSSFLNDAAPLCTSLHALITKHKNIDTMLKQFAHHKRTLPICCCAILNSALDKILLVRGRGGFLQLPGGKKACNETEMQCAAREVHEETGVHVEDKLMEKHCIRIPAMRRTGKHGISIINCTVYIVVLSELPGPLRPRSYEEIREIKWVHLKQIHKAGCLSDALKKAKGLLNSWITAHKK